MNDFKTETVTREQAADILTVSTKTVDRWIRLGRLTAYRVGPRAVRVTRESVRAVVEAAAVVRPFDATRAAG